MRKKLVLALLCVFVLAFAFGATVSTTQAAKPCIGTCINNTWLICCPDGAGGWECYWGGYCDWPGWIP
jgi:hypothetical protein